MTSSFGTKANPQQLEAIRATNGPVLIIAGPGTGKTFTLVERIVYLIKEEGVAPESLFVVTFTEKAARELTTRASNRLAELDIKFNLNDMYLGTFHSVCLRLLEDYREYTRLKRSYTCENALKCDPIQDPTDAADNTDESAVAEGSRDAREVTP